MPKYRLTGDICHPGVVEFNGTEDELRDLLGQDMKTGMIAIADYDEEELVIYDVDRSEKIAGFIPDGSIQDEDGNDVELPDELDAKRSRLQAAEAAFAEAGGRGVELAEEIDSLRAALAAFEVPLQITKGGDADGNDYEVPEALAKEGFWLTVGKSSIHIRLGCDGVSVSMYALRGEADDALSEAWVTHGELELEEPK